MSALAASAVTALVTAVLAVAATFVTTRRNLEVQYDSELRKLRIDAYSKLWGHLSVLAKYGRPRSIDRRGVQKLCRQLTTWYFEDGGIFLSDPTKRDYFALQDGLELLEREPEREPTAEDDEFIRVLASRLRTGMTRDIGARKTFMLRSDAEPSAKLRVPQCLHTGEHAIAVRVRRHPDLRRPFRRLGSWLGRSVLAEAVELKKKHGDEWRPIQATWEADRQGIKTTQISDTPGDRLALYEGNYVLEGPTGWSRLDHPAPLQTHVWRPSESGAEDPSPE